MRGLKLEEYEQYTIIEMRKYHPNAKVRERAYAIELLSMGFKRIDVAKTLKRMKDTISDWVVSYKEKGISGLFDNERTGRHRKVTNEIRERIIEISESPKTCTKNSIKEDIEKEFGVRFHINTIKYHLKKRKVCL
jgi:transposase